MQRPRLRLRRKGGVLALLVLLALLLELNVFLPGTWPGGMDGGFRRWTVHTPAHDRLRPSLDLLPQEDPGSVTVILHGGGAGEEVAVDAPGSLATQVDDHGRAVLGGSRLLASGFLVKHGRGEIRHGPADPSIARAWMVHLPTPLPVASGAPKPLEIEVRAEEDGQPLAGARVVATTPDGPVEAVTDETGRARIEGARGRTRIEVEAEGRHDAEHWTHPLIDAPLDVRLAVLPVGGLRVEAADGTDARLERVRAVAPDGRVLWESASPEPSHVATIPPPTGVPGARLEIHATGHPILRIPLDDLPEHVRLPQGRTVHVDVRDRDGRVLRGVRVHASYVPVDLDGNLRVGAEPSEVTVDLSADAVVLPALGSAHLVVEAEGSAPAGLYIAPDEAGDRRRVELAPGRSLDVRVMDERGAPVAAATVIALVAVNSGRVRRTGTTLPDGTVTLRELPPGPVEVYAHGHGTAWSATVVATGAQQAPVGLVVVPAKTLRLIVETPLGLPLSGVRVLAEPLDDGPPDAVPPDARPWRTSREGTLVLDGLRDRAYRLRLGLPGYRMVTIDEVYPGPGIHFVTLVPEPR